MLGSARCFVACETDMTCMFVAVHARIVRNTSKQLVLNCTISGFDSNIPDIDYDWTLNDALIPHPHDHFIAAASVHSLAELATSSKFVVSFDGTELSLTVKNPSKLTGKEHIYSSI